MRIAAFIPARGGSKGLPRKNLLDFLGSPMVAHAIQVARRADIFDDIYVNTDDDEIARIAEAAGALVIRRPAELGTDTAEVDPLLCWTLDHIEQVRSAPVPDLGALLYCTAPLRQPEDIAATVRLVTTGGFDCALTLVEDHSYLWSRNPDGSMRPTNYVPAKRAARQTEGWNQFIENKAVYVFRTEDIRRTGCRINGRIGAHLMPVMRSIDVDSDAVYRLALVIARSGLV